MLIPAVSRIAKEWKTGKVLRLNVGEFVGSKANQRFADRIGVQTTPTFILFDKDGQEQCRWVGEAPTLSDLP